MSFESRHGESSMQWGARCTEHMLFMMESREHVFRASVKQSPMAVDIYCWATYRMCYCHSRTFIPWEDLALQFGSIESNLRKFKFRFKKHLVSVQKIYPDFKCDTSDPKGLVIFPSKTSIKKTK